MISIALLANTSALIHEELKFIPSRNSALILFDKSALADLARFFCMIFQSFLKERPCPHFWVKKMRVLLICLLINFDFLKDDYTFEYAHLLQARGNIFVLCFCLLRNKNSSLVLSFANRFSPVFTPR